MFRLRVLTIAVVAALAAVSPANASFRVCNKTDHPIAIAIGRIQAKVWISEGWWQVKPRGCGDILRGPLKARYYYLRAVHLGADGGWDGNRFFCIAQANFTIKGREDCRKRGYGKAGFFEVDTGEFSDFVQNLSD